MWNLNMKSKSSALLLSLSLALSAQPRAFAQSAVPPPPAPAPTLSSPASSDQPAMLAPVVVTGSNIPAPANAAIKPVEVIGSVQVANSGEETDLADILRKTSTEFSGNGNLGLENANSEAFFTQGGSFLQIHNLATLVLINGRRVAFDPAAAGLGGEFVDLNMIPPAAIDRIEIVSDGASAIYGSDAVGGVINVILKSNFNGWEAGIHWGESSNKGGYTERSGYLSGGVSNDTTSIMVSVEGTKTSPIYMSQRPYSNPIYGVTSYPGIISVNPINLMTGQSGPLSYYKLNPSLNAPPGFLQYSISQLVQMGVYIPETAQQVLGGYNIAGSQTLLSSLSRRSAVLDFEHKIFGDKLVVFGDGIYSWDHTQSSVIGDSISPYLSAPFTDPLVYGSSPPPPGAYAYIPYVPFTNLESPFSPSWLYQGATVNLVNVGNLFSQYPNMSEDTSDFVRFAGGLRGAISPDYSWEAGIDLNRYHLGYSGTGQIDTANLNAALASGAINPFAYSQPLGSLPGNIIGTKSNSLSSTLISEDVILRGTPFQLPSGALSFAVGASHTYERLSASPDAVSQSIAPGLSIAGWLDSQSLSPFAAHRDFTSLFAEVKIPIVGPQQNLTGLHKLTLDVAGRYDDYTVVGGTTVPNIGLNYQPIDDQFSVRGSVGRSFGAPQLYQLFGPSVSGPIPPFSYQSLYGFTASGAGFNGFDNSNPNLKPFRANTWSAGFDLTPRSLPGFELTFDFFGASQAGAIGYLNQVEIVQSVELLGPASPYAQYVHVGSPTGPEVKAAGQLSTSNPTSIYVFVPLLNLANQLDRGFDVGLNFTWNTPSLGRFALSSTATIWSSYLVQETPLQKYYDYVGTATGGGSDSQGTIPQWKIYTTLTWSTGNFDATVGHTYIPSVNDIGAGGSFASAPVGVSSYQQFDGILGWDFSKGTSASWLKNLKMRVGVNNAFNEMPPVAPGAFPSTNADVGDYGGPIGRLYFVDATYRF
jgi:iron complex outermembrane receptor protein